MRQKSVPKEETGDGDREEHPTRDAAARGGR